MCLGQLAIHGAIGQCRIRGNGQEAWKGFGYKYNSWVEEEDAHRKPIQQKWNEIAHGSGAAGIEFVNQVDDEEAPPGIGTLFCYLERSYILLSSLLSSFWSYSRKISELGIPEPSRLVEYQCSCQTALGAPYTSQVPIVLFIGGGFLIHVQGFFTFNTDSEIFECNEVQDNNTSFLRIILRQSSAASVRPLFKTKERRWGVRVPQNLVAGQILGLYTGRREDAKELSGSRASYCFDLDINEDPEEDHPQTAYSVDAFASGGGFLFLPFCFANGNWTRFIKLTVSSFDPESLCANVIQSLLQSQSENNFCGIQYYAQAFVELTFDYNPAHQAEYELKRYREKTKSKKQKSKHQTPCLCGAPNCRGWLSVAA
ncbi:hypothetical protein B0H13DRAFT_1887979 [Mycena leptocephala]|nr:hypothetical protein B0H13DRAFT_1887979 [Mycena leptocephala]